MPSVRYAPTSKFNNHSSGTTFERVRFIIIDDDLDSAFSPTNLAALFGGSEKYRHYHPTQPDTEGKGIKCNDSLVDSGVLINEHFCANIEQKGSCLHRAASTDIGGQKQNKEKKGKEFLAKLHACYHRSQVSNITKFVCWSHGPTNGYIPQITLLFKEGTNPASKFDWQQSPLASVFMCNKSGGVEKLAFGDDTVSGLEFVSLGEPIGNFISAHEDASSFISLIPGSGRADEIFDTLIDKAARKNRRPQVDDSAAILSSSQSTDEDCLMMKKAPANKKQLWTNRHSQTDFDDSAFKSPTGKQLVRTKASCQTVFHTGPDKQSSKAIFRPEISACRALTWFPPNIPMATKFSTRVGRILPGGASRSSKHAAKAEGGNLALVAIIPGVSRAKTVTTSLGKHIEECKKSKQACERLPGLSRTHSTYTTVQEDYNQTRAATSDPEIMNITGNDIPVNSHNKYCNGQKLIKEQGELKEHEELDILDEIIGKMHTQRQVTNGRLATSGSMPVMGDGREKLPTNRKFTAAAAAENMQLADYRKKHFFSSELRGLKCGPGIIRVLGGKALAFPSESRSSKLDRRGLPSTCIRTNNPPASAKQSFPPTTPLTPPATPVCESPDTEDPVFKGCLIQRGFDPIYPSDETPKKVFQDRVGGLENWYAFPMIQVAREFLPEGMKDTDWSWTDNDVSGEFIPGGVAW